MSLLILEKKGTFYLQGKFNYANLSAIKLHIEYFLKKKKYVTIDISKVTEIDIYGVEALTKIYNKALLTDRIFTIIGHGSKDLYDHFNGRSIA